MVVRFIGEFWFRHTAQVKTRYPEGYEGPVTKRCGEAAIAAGKAVRVKKKAASAGGEDGS
ncbi:MAG: hypothetical protein AB7S41_20115 [Parvibaculaceae bacterium]